MEKENGDLKRALLLVREYRKQVYLQNISPIASRIALKFALLCDDHFARRRLTAAQEIEIEETALKLYEQSKGTL